MPVNVSVPANISVLQADFECHGNEKSLLGCLDSKSYSYTCKKRFLKAVAGVICEGKVILYY